MERKYIFMCAYTHTHIHLYLHMYARACDCSIWRYIVFEYSLLPDFLFCFILRFELFKITLLVYLPKRPLLLLPYASVLFKWVQSENSKRQELLHDLQTATKQN